MSEDEQVEDLSPLGKLKARTRATFGVAGGARVIIEILDLAYDLGKKRGHEEADEAVLNLFRPPPPTHARRCVSPLVAEAYAASMKEAERRGGNLVISIDKHSENEVWIEAILAGYRDGANQFFSYATDGRTQEEHVSEALVEYAKKLRETT